MFSILFFLFILKCTTAQPATTIDPTTTASPMNTKRLTVGMIVTEVLQSQIGFSITGGVIPLALERIANLSLLDSIEFDFVVNYTDCTELNAAGIAVHMLKEINVDVVLGPACSQAIVPVGILSTFYQTPQIAWGFASSATLSDGARFPYLTTISPNYRQLGYAFQTLLQMFQWGVVALLYGDTGAGNCPNMINDVKATLTDPIFNNSITIASTQRMEIGASRASMVNVLQKLRSRARVIGVCLPDDQIKRNFLIATTEAGMNGTDYVYVLLDLKGFGFGQLGQGGPGTIKLENGLTPVWYDTVNNNKDGLDSVAQQAATQVLVIDLTNQGTVNGMTTTQLVPQVLENVKGTPFYCNTTDQQNDQKYSGVNTTCLGCVIHRF